MLKRTSRILACCLTLMLIFSAVMPAYAAEDSLYDLQMLTESIEALADDNNTITVDESLPSTFDLRNVNGQNFVTYVKNQGLLGSCWAFASTAAMETSLIYEFWQDQGINLVDVLDLSEHHLSWFGRAHITEETGVYQDQLGEGFYLVNEDENQMDTGGTAVEAGSLVMSGAGPAAEADYPYKNKSGNLTDISKSGKGYYVYTVDGEDWSLPDASMYSSLYDLSESSSLPSPANISYASDRSLIYTYDESATQAIKSELYNGRAVAVSYYCYAGGSLEDQEENSSDDDTVSTLSAEQGDNMNPDTYAVYTYYPMDPNHGVTIVGWDDTYSRTNFGVDGDESKKPSSDGAWIVKNSWGSLDGDTPNKNNWGVDGTGYFYISYEDQSLVMPTTYDFDLSSIVEDRIINQYDLMQYQAIGTAPFYQAASNVYTAESDQEIYAISTLTAEPGSTVQYQVYLLNENYTDPTDGTLILDEKETYTYGGFHRIELESPLKIKEGQAYSVIESFTTSDGTSTFPIALSYSKSYADATGSLSEYAVAVINEGESYGLNFDGTWSDWYAEVEEYKQSGLASDAGYYQYEFDNFAFKTYSTPCDLTEIDTEKVDGKPDETKTYAAGDTVTFEFNYTLPAIEETAVQSDDDSDSVTVALSDTLGLLSDEQKSVQLKAGETKTVSVDYTLKEEDVKDGKIIQTFTLTPDSQDYKTQEVTYTLTVKTDSDADNTDTTGGNTASGGNTTSGGTSANAKTGVETNNTAVYVIIGVLIVAVLAAVIVISKKKAKQQ